MSEVWITGIGVIAPSGYGLEALTQVASSGIPALKPCPPDYGPPHAEALIGAISSIPSEQFFTSRQLRMMDRAMELSASTVGFALEDAGIEMGSAVLDQMATFFATTRAEYPSILRFIQPMTQGRQVNPAHFPLVARNIALGQICIRFGLRGPSTMVASGALGVFEALGRAAAFIRSGRIACAVVGGFEVLSKYQMDLAQDLYQPLNPGKPAFFGLEPGYIAPAEGACAFILESQEHAQRRKAAAFAKIDAFQAGRVSSAHVSQAQLAPLQRLQHSIGRSLFQIGALLPIAGGSNRIHERTELAMVEALLEQHELPICAVRSLIGEGEVAASALQVGLGLHGLRTGRIPVSLNIAATASARVASCAQAQQLPHPTAVISGFDAVGRYALLGLSAV